MERGTTKLPRLEAPENGDRPVVRVGGFEAIRRHPFAFILPLAVFLAVALAYGLTRPAVYTSETRLGIAKVDANAPGALAGFAVASQSLAEAYSRIIDAEPVIEDTAKGVGLSDITVRERVRAVPVPDTPVFRVVAQGPSAEGSVALANATGASLERYIAELNRSAPESRSLLRRYDASVRRLERLRDVLDRVEGADAPRERLVDARARVETERLRADALRETYSLSAQSGGSSPVPQTLTQAVAATSDRMSRLQILLFIALVAGAAVGLALALFRANAEVRRQAL